MNHRMRACPRARKTTLIGAGIILVVMLSLAAAWRWTPFQEVAEPGMMIHWLRESGDSPWMPVLVGALFVAASWVLFPNTVLCLGVILALGPVLGTAYAFGGSMLAAVVGYSMGRWGHRRIEKLQISAFDQISKQLRRGGFFQVLAIRVLPVAPFSATNILAGALRLRLVPFAAATAVGIAPYIVTFGVFGRQARRLLSNPSPTDVALAVGIVAVAAIVAWLAHSRWKYA
jgi:uncharacterized membrane protein YdjX (TVP38/TMEM64 family)